MAMVLGWGSAFLYRQGLLCYHQGDTIRILNVQEAALSEAVIDLVWLSSRVMNMQIEDPMVQLINLQDSILSFVLVEPNGGQGIRWIMCVKIQGAPVSHDRVVRIIPTTQSKNVIRNNSRYIFKGSHDGLSANGHHHEWIWHRFDMQEHEEHTKRLQIPELAGTDLGQTVLFEIFDGYFYAISNQSTVEAEEVEWSSYYHCYRFPVNEPKPASLQKIKIWRRQHREGPINDSWTDLNLHKDENTGALVIVEGRREWIEGKSVQKRTFYRQILPADFTENGDQIEEIIGEPQSTRSDEQRIEDESTISSSSQSNNDPSVSAEAAPQYFHYIVPKLEDQPSHPRIPRDTHPEFSDDSPPPPIIDNVMLAKSKYRTYNLSASAFFDLVIDDRPCGSSARSALYPPQQQIRLRVGSRILASPLNSQGYIHASHYSKQTRKKVDGSELRYKDQGIRLWPPSNAPRRLLDLLNSGPPDHTRGLLQSSARNQDPRLCRPLGEVCAVADERSVIYMAKGTRMDQEGEWGKMVLVCFDARMKFRCEGWEPGCLSFCRRGSD